MKLFMVYKYPMTYNIENIWNKLLKLKNLPFGSVSCITDSNLDDEVSNIISEVAIQGCLNNPNIQEKFLNRYYDWIQETKLNTFKGLEKFKTRAFSNGTTESFDKFYLKNKNRRIRYFQGEYMYHVAAAHSYFEQSAYIEEDLLSANDVVIFSLPFADTGDEHPNMHEILKKCDDLNIPVMIDCCYFGLCRNINFDFSYNCIYGIAFSLSKSFPVQHLRIGMRLTKDDDDDPLLVYNRNKYVNRVGAAVGFEILNRYSPDYNQNMYYEVQKVFCDKLGVTPSSCVFFANSTDKFLEYNRGTSSNRLCFSKYLKSGVLPKE
jgi:hypothetical protein